MAHPPLRTVLRQRRGFHSGHRRRFRRPRQLKRESRICSGPSAVAAATFGVVTEFEVKLHPLTSVVLAEGLTPEPEIRPLLECWREFMADAPLDLKWNIDLRLAPHTEKVPTTSAAGPWPRIR